MKIVPKSFRSMVVAVAGIVACCFTASAQTVIFSDNYKGADGDLDSASLVDRTSGLDASGVLPQSTSAQQTIAGGKLQLVCRGGAKSGTSGGMHFGTIGSPGTLWDWSSGAGGSAITKAGGMSVSFNFWPRGPTRPTVTERTGNCSPSPPPTPPASCSKIAAWWRFGTPVSLPPATLSPPRVSATR